MSVPISKMWKKLFWSSCGEPPWAEWMNPVLSKIPTLNPATGFPGLFATTVPDEGPQHDAEVQFSKNRSLLVSPLRLSAAKYPFR